jgi:hypothetical protein
MYDSESSSDGGWISWFCDLEGHEFFVEVNPTKFFKFFFINRSMSSTLKIASISMVSRREYQSISKQLDSSLSFKQSKI